MGFCTVVEEVVGAALVFPDKGKGTVAVAKDGLGEDNWGCFSQEDLAPGNGVGVFVSAD